MIPQDPEMGLLSGSAVDASRVINSEETQREVEDSIVRISELAELTMGTPLQDMDDRLFQDFLARERVKLDPLLRIVGSVLLKAYYTDPAARAALGVGSGAPFPSGSRVHDGDIELLEPVYNRGQIYRDVDCEH
jgi:hypothetical protein